MTCHTYDQSKLGRKRVVAVSKSASSIADDVRDGFLSVHMYSLIAGEGPPEAELVIKSTAYGNFLMHGISASSSLSWEAVACERLKLGRKGTIAGFRTASSIADGVRVAG